MLAFQETSNGGRIARGNSPYGRYLVEWDGEGKQLQNYIVIADPNNGHSQHPADQKRQDSTAATRIAPPGDWLYAMIYAATLGTMAHCLQCAKRRAAMNAAGWFGLPWLTITSIRDWIMTKWKRY